jgi:hypothetical protein
MKRGTPEHWKMKLLSQKLNIPLAHAVGIMELLWHYVAKIHPQGDISSSPDWVIAEACKWNLQKRPDGPGIDYERATKFVDALVESGWLDRDIEVVEISIDELAEWQKAGSVPADVRHISGTSVAGDRHSTGRCTAGQRRLAVHDWHEHVDPYVKKALKTKGLGIFCSARKLGLDSLPIPIPSPIPNISSAADTTGERRANAALQNPPREEPEKDKPKTSLTVANLSEVPEWRDWAQREMRWDDDRILREFDLFRDHAMANGRKYADWLAAFRMWCKKSADFERSGAAGRSSSNPPTHSSYLTLKPYEDVDTDVIN